MPRVHQLRGVRAGQLQVAVSDAVHVVHVNVHRVVRLAVGRQVLLRHARAHVGVLHVARDNGRALGRRLSTFLCVSSGVQCR